MNSKYLENDPHWSNLPYPLKPCDEEVNEYKKHLLDGNTLLLGSTYQLLDLCDVAIDLNPRYSHIKLSKGDWYNISGFYTNIIADGSINLTGPSLIKDTRQR